MEFPNAGIFFPISIHFFLAFIFAETSFDGIMYSAIMLSVNLYFGGLTAGAPLSIPPNVIAYLFAANFAHDSLSTFPFSTR